MSLLLGCSKKPVDYVSVLEELELSELKATFGKIKINGHCPPEAIGYGPDQEIAAAVLASLDLKGNRKEILEQWASHPITQLLDTAAQPSWLEDDAQIIESFSELLTQPLEEKISTGYNIMPESQWPDFDPTRTIIYGHNDLKHALQLHALWYSEGMRPKVSFLHKNSAFLYNDDWGEPTIPLVPLKNGDRLVVAIEYDLCIEFEEEQDIERFFKLVTRYAKKNTPEESGLIYDSWWQPFYRTFQPSSFGEPLTVLLVRYEGYRANLMSMPKEATEKLAKLGAMQQDWTVEEVDIWVNPAFYRFQLGDYK